MRILGGDFMVSILIILLLAQANGFIVPASCWWVFGVSLALYWFAKIVCKFLDQKS